MPHGVSRSVSRMCAGVEISGVRFWNLTASAPGFGGDVDEPLGELDVAVVVQPDLGDDVGGAASADHPRSDGDGHGFFPSVGDARSAVRWAMGVGRRSRSTRSASSLTAPCPPGPADDHTGGGEHERVRFGDGDGIADDLETAEVVDVVADVGDLGERDPLFLHPLAQRGRLCRRPPGARPPAASARAP